MQVMAAMRYFNRLGMPHDWFTDLIRKVELALAPRFAERLDLRASCGSRRKRVRGNMIRSILLILTSNLMQHTGPYRLMSGFVAVTIRSSKFFRRAAYPSWVEDIRSFELQLSWTNHNYHITYAIGQRRDLNGPKPATNSRPGSPQSAHRMHFNAADKALLR